MWTAVPSCLFSSGWPAHCLSDGHVVPEDEGPPACVGPPGPRGRRMETAELTANSLRRATGSVSPGPHKGRGQQQDMPVARLAVRTLDLLDIGHCLDVR